MGTPKAAGVTLALTALLAGCGREPDLPPPMPAPPRPPVTGFDAPRPAGAQAALRVTGDPRSPRGMACWTCYFRAREAVKGVPGVAEVKVYPDSGLILLRADREKLDDGEALMKALEKAMPGASGELLDEPPVPSTRVRLTKQMPASLRAAFDRAAGENKTLIVFRCDAKACASCVREQPEIWDDAVLLLAVDVDETPGAKTWLTPEAVPEWVCVDRSGTEVGRWRGRIDPMTFHPELARMIERARQ